MEKGTLIYEIGYMFKDSLEGEELLSFTEKIRNIITSNNSIIISEGKPKKQPTAYLLKKEASGIFNWAKFQTSPDSIGKIENELKKEDHILRFMTTRSKKDEPLRPTLTAFRRRIIAEPQEKTEIKIISPEEAATSSPVHEEETPNTKIKEEELDKQIEKLLGN